MLIFLIFLGLVILAALCVLLYFFSVAFVKQNMGVVDDVDAPVNVPLSEYKEDIRRGIDFVNNTPHKWVHTVSFDGLKLAARYFENNSIKTIILFHGYRSSAARDFSCAVKMYLSFGFNVLLIDQRSHGRSEGRLITFGIKESRDALCWTELVSESLGAEKIAFSGLSMGATTVLLACGLGLPEKVNAIIADCGFTSPIDIINKVARESFRVNGKFVMPFLNLLCIIFGRFSLYNVSTVDSVKKTDIPILFIHGKGDNFVPHEMSEAAFEAANEGSEFISVPNAGHGLSFLVDTELVKAKVKDFLDKNVS